MAAYHDRSSTPPADVAEAAVLLLLYPGHDDQAHIVFIERVTHQKDRHSGQIAFPGGRKDDRDHNLVECALREAKEEISVDPQSIHVIGTLTDLYIPVSNFKVTPVVGITEIQPEFEPQPSEVAVIYQEPISTFWKADIRQEIDLKLSRGILLKNVPYFNVQQRIVWGATAMIMNEFLHLFEKI